MNQTEQQFFNDLEKKLWASADKLRSNLDAAVYKHIALGLLFLKYVSDAFEERQNELNAQFRNPDHDYYMAPENHPEDYEANIAALRDEYPGLASLEQYLRAHGWENAEVPSEARAES